MGWDINSSKWKMSPSWRGVYSEKYLAKELCGYSNFIGEIKSCQIGVDVPVRKRPLWRFCLRWEENMAKDLKLIYQFPTEHIQPHIPSENVVDIFINFIINKFSHHNIFYVKIFYMKIKLQKWHTYIRCSSKLEQ